MKKEYTKLTINIEQLEQDTILVESHHKNKPGYGWGDGGHTGPPGHNKLDFIFNEPETNKEDGNTENRE